MKRLISTEDGSSKFWEGKVQGTSFVAKFGKIGSAGQIKVKTFSSVAEAEKELAKLTKEKLAKGYVEDDGGSAAPPAPAKGKPVAKPAANKGAEKSARAGKSKKLVVKWGYLDETGGWTLTPRFDDARQFSEGLAAVKVGDLWGYIDPTGAFAIEPRYGSGGAFKNGVATVTDPKSTSGYPVDRSGQKLPEIERSRGDASPFSRHDALYPAQQGKLYGYVDASHRWVIDARFASAAPFSEGLAWVEVPKGKGLAAIDTSGKVRFETSFPMAAEFSDGMARVAALGGRVKRFGYVDTSGKLVIDLGDAPTAPNWGRHVPHPGGEFSEGLVGVWREGKGFAVLDKTGKQLFQTDFDRILPFRNGFARVLSQPTSAHTEFWGFIDREGNVLVDPCLSRASDFEGGLAYVEYSSSCEPGASQDWSKGLIDVRGKVVVAGLDRFRGFDEQGFAIAADVDGGKLLGAVDRKGRWVIEAKFERIEPFVKLSVGERAAARLNNKWGLIDRTGAWKVPPKFDRMGVVRERTMVNVGAKVNPWNDQEFSGGKYGFIDGDGHEVIALEYEGCGGMIEGMAAASTRVEESPVAAAAREAESGKHPFLAYGLAPLDFAEGANMGHCYVLRFVKAPDKGMRAKIAAAFEKAVAKDPVELELDEWEWNEEWLELYVGEKHDDDDDDFSHGSFFGHVRRAIEAVHKTAPLAEATFLGSQAPNPTSDWEAWSLRMQPSPTQWPFKGSRSLGFKM